MEPETVRAAVARYFAAIRQMDADAWVACFAEQATSYEPGLLLLCKAMRHCANSFSESSARSRKSA